MTAPEQPVRRVTGQASRAARGPGRLWQIPVFLLGLTAVIVGPRRPAQLEPALAALSHT